MDIFSCAYDGPDYTNGIPKSIIGKPGYFFKAVYSNYRPAHGRDRKLIYRPGTDERFRAARWREPQPELCTGKVLHACATPNQVLYYYSSFCQGSGSNRLLRVYGTPVAVGDDKLGMRTLKVIEELPGWRVWGPNGRQVLQIKELTWKTQLTDIQRKIGRGYNTGGDYYTGTFSTERVDQFLKIKERLAQEGYTQDTGMIYSRGTAGLLQLLLMAKPILDPEFFETVIREGWDISVRELNAALANREAKPKPQTLQAAA